MPYDVGRQKLRPLLEIHTSSPMTTTSLSEMVASAPPSRDHTIAPDHPYTTIDHPIVRRNFNEWRDVPPDDRVAHSVRGNLPDVIPLATDGVRYIGRFVGATEGSYFVGHVTNLLKPEKVREAAKPKVQKEPKPRNTAIKTIVVVLDDLFGE
jgi:hypothetical protein